MTLWKCLDKVVCCVRWPGQVIKPDDYIITITSSLERKLQQAYMQMDNIIIAVDKKTFKTLARVNGGKPGIPIDKKSSNTLRD